MGGGEGGERDARVQRGFPARRAPPPGRGAVRAGGLHRLPAGGGALPFLPGLGRRLYLLGREKPSARQALAAQYVAEALREEPELAVESVELTQAGETGLLTVFLSWEGEELTVQLPLVMTAGGVETR